jgi:hypothetical protein
MKEISFSANCLVQVVMLICLTSVYAEDKMDRSYFEGYAVEFDYEGHNEERQKLYDFFMKNGDFEFHPLEKNQIGIDFYDIDDDGQKEILVYLHNMDSCGALGCSFQIFKKDHEDYRIHCWNPENYQNLWWNPTRTNDGIITRPEVKILNNKTKGFHDIVFYGFHFFKSKFTYSVWQWQGYYYYWTQSFDAFAPHELGKEW